MADELIYVVEDDAQIRNIIKEELTSKKFTVEVFSSATSFLRQLRRKTPSLCIVDLRLPDTSDFQLVRELGDIYQIPTIVVTGQVQLADRVMGLELGADDYITKPFEPRELSARVRSVLRRIELTANQQKGKSANIASFDRWYVDFSKFELFNENDEKFELGRSEIELLEILVKNPNRVLTRETLLDLLGMKQDPTFDRSIDVRISRLRSKIETNPKSPMYIKTVYGVGYLLAAQVTWTTTPPASGVTDT